MQENIEIWKDVIGYEGIYQVSNLGRVKSLDREILTKNGYVKFKEKILSLRICGKGYLSVVLQVSGMKKTKMVHRLVAECFILNINNYEEVNHIDENKLNNNVENLEWCDHLYNSRYGTRGSRISIANTDNKLRMRKVLMSKDNKPLKEFNSVKCAYEYIYNTIGKNGNSIRKALCNDRKTAYGYQWEYIK